MTSNQTVEGAVISQEKANGNRVRRIRRLLTRIYVLGPILALAELAVIFRVELIRLLAPLISVVQNPLNFSFIAAVAVAAELATLLRSRVKKTNLKNIKKPAMPSLFRSRKKGEVKTSKSTQQKESNTPDTALITELSKLHSTHQAEIKLMEELLQEFKLIKGEFSKLSSTRFTPQPPPAPSKAEEPNPPQPPTPQPTNQAKAEETTRPQEIVDNEPQISAEPKFNKIVTPRPSDVNRNLQGEGAAVVSVANDLRGEVKRLAKVLKGK
ncbi:MAG: hypothetical protein HYU39_06615 [Thaumarchaeota archaeon]|nr:hypothetical protein [Nitrososphaerota archaeon]